MKITAGVMQIVWATKDSSFLNHVSMYIFTIFVYDNHSRCHAIGWATKDSSFLSHESMYIFTIYVYENHSRCHANSLGDQRQ